MPMLRGLSVGHNYTEVVELIKVLFGVWSELRWSQGTRYYLGSCIIKVLFGVWSEIRWSRGTRYYLGSCIPSGEEEILGGQPIVKCSEFPRVLIILNLVQWVEAVLWPFAVSICSSLYEISCANFPGGGRSRGRGRTRRRDSKGRALSHSSCHTSFHRCCECNVKF